MADMFNRAVGILNRADVNRGTRLVKDVELQLDLIGNWRGGPLFRLRRRHGQLRRNEEEAACSVVQTTNKVRETDKGWPAWWS